jgi:pectinesterase
MRTPALALLLVSLTPAVFAGVLPPPDLVVAADGSGDFQTIQAALSSIPATNRERTVVFIRNGVYREKIRVDASFATLRGESRAGTRIEFAQLNDDFTKHPDALGRAVINLDQADDFVLENLTAENTAGEVGPHAFTIYGKGDRTVIVGCDLLSHGADTVSLWLGDRGRYYHADCRFQGSVDFVCPRGWCYATRCAFYEMKPGSAAVWHDGRVNPDMKFVLRDCTFDGVPGWVLGRHHVDAQFYFLDCRFSRTLADHPITRVIYPDDPQRNAALDKSNRWGERNYFYNCHREGGDFGWFTNNLVSAPGAPRPGEITVAWTFDGTWDPERTNGPVIRRAVPQPGRVSLRFSEPVTVKGRPRLVMRDGSFADYASGSGTDTLAFTLPATDPSEVASVNLNGGFILASEASATLRPASLVLPGGSSGGNQ